MANKYRALVDSLKEERSSQGSHPQELEITWDTGLQEKTQHLVARKKEEKAAEALTLGEK